MLSTFQKLSEAPKELLFMWAVCSHICCVRNESQEIVKTQDSASTHPIVHQSTDVTRSTASGKLHRVLLKE